MSEPTAPPDGPDDGSAATASQRAQAQAVGDGAPERHEGSTGPTGTPE
ncbi:MAG: hypothetical protein ACXV0U_09920 [Kineosporiaceae bacterium]